MFEPRNVHSLHSIGTPSGEVDPLAPYGYDKYGKRRTHWCTTWEHMRDYQECEPRNTHSSYFIGTHSKECEQVYLHGTYYNPASDHYKGNGSVVCDRCSRENLAICIGYKNNDLCIPCVKEMSNQKKSESIVWDDNDRDIYGYPKKWHVTPM